MYLAESYWYPICFFISGLLLLSGALFQTELTLYVALLLFLAWDIRFASDPENFQGRSAEYTIQQVVQARSYISYFIPFYGILLGFFLMKSNLEREEFLAFISNANIELWWLIAPFFISTVVILLFPIRFTLENKKLTPSIMMLMICNFFAEKCAIFIFSHFVLRVLVAWNS